MYHTMNAKYANAGHPPPPKKKKKENMKKNVSNLNIEGLEAQVAKVKTKK